MNEIRDLIEQLETLHSEMTRLETSGLSSDVQDGHLHGARNLLHYVALRRHDIRDLQRQLSAMGMSSLGRTESHVLPSLNAVLELLHRISGSGTAQLMGEDAIMRAEGRRRLEENTEALLGPAPEGRSVRIMVTMPSEAATDYELVRNLVASGMNCMRINCAHDGPSEWLDMIQNLRRAEKELGKTSKVEMDLAGPKLRTGPMEAGPQVVKVRPHRDSYGRLRSNARVWLTSSDHPEPAPVTADGCVPVSPAWLRRLEDGNRVQFRDARGAKRSFKICERVGKSRWAECSKTAYIVSGLSLFIDGPSPVNRRARVGELPAEPQKLLLRRDDTLILTRDLTPGTPAVRNERGDVLNAARVGVTLPEFFECVQPGEPIWFDDGNIGGVVVAVKPYEVHVKITHARPEGEKLGGEKGINVPQTNLRVPCLSPEDLECLEFAVKHSDIVGLSFVRTKDDVAELHEHLKEMGGEGLGILLKIETQEGFANLPEILMSAMASRAVGVMIARGDLAVECGYQRLAELQEEILWISEAAHIPVVWATQVLESLARTGKPTRSEITDAAMGERAECVMLNKGPYIGEAVQVLDDILRRMEAHQDKKTSMLRKLEVAASFAM
jgi:pyruvate kinase